MKKNSKAVVLLSGGIDSTVCLAFAMSKGYECYAMSFNYGQRHGIELRSAAKVAKKLGVFKHIIVKINLDLWGGSALTSKKIKVPKNDLGKTIPITYVPARNIVFLSFATSFAETIGAKDIFIGVNSVDYSGYPDCRPQFISTFENCVNIGTKTGVGESGFKIHAPLQKRTKADIIKLGTKLGLDFSLTHSCYDPGENGRACGYCDSCLLREKGFIEAGISDPTKYLKITRNFQL